MKSIYKLSLVALAVVGLTACNQEQDVAQKKVELITDLGPSFSDAQATCDSLLSIGIKTSGWKPSAVDTGAWNCISSYVEVGSSKDGELPNNIALYGTGTDKSSLNEIKIVTNINNATEKKVALDKTIQAVNTFLQSQNLKSSSSLITAITSIKSYQEKIGDVTVFVQPELTNIESIKIIFTKKNISMMEAYSVGGSIGKYMSGHIKEQEELGFAVDRTMVIKGFTDGLGEEMLLTEEEMQTVLENLDKKLNDKRLEQAEIIAAKAIADGQKFLDDNKAKEGVITTDSGLQYEVLEAGSGEKPAAEDTVEVHYRGTLTDGTEFDSSYARGETAKFPLNRVIPGWTEGVQLMSVGAKYKFVIPAELAYGDRETGTIPANSTLVFEVELVSVEKAAAAAETK